MNKDEYVERARFIWRTFVPLNGQAEFEQGELIRSVEKLRNEAQRNANANFNDKCHKILVAFLREKLADKSVFNENIINQINSDIDQIGTKDHPYLDNDIYDRLSERVVDWCAIYQEPIPHNKNPELNC